MNGLLGNMQTDRQQIQQAAQQALTANQEYTVQLSSQANQSEIRVYELNAPSMEGVRRFFREYAKPNDRARFLFTPSNIPTNRVVASTKTFPATYFSASDYINKAFGIMEQAQDVYIDGTISFRDSSGQIISEPDYKFAKKYPELEGRSPFDLLSIFKVKVILMPNRGGCNKNKVAITSVNDLKLTSFPARDNNCGLALIRNVLGDDEFVKRVCEKRGNAIKIGNIYQVIRRDFGLAGPLSAEQLKRVSDYLEVKVLFIDPKKQCLITNQTVDLTNTSEYVFVLHKNHWYLLSAVVGWKTCECGKRLREDNTTHQCNVNVFQFYKSEIKEEEIKRTQLKFDLETRNDLEQPKVHYAHDDKGKPFGPPKYSYYQVPTCLCYWTDGEFTEEKFEAGEYSNLIYTGVDCVDRFLDFLVAESKEKRWFQLKAHNGSRFDFFFILEAILRRDPNFESDKSILVKGTQILSMKWYGHEFMDTANHLGGSLTNLCRDYQVSVPKLKEVQINGQVMSTMDLCLYRADLGPQGYLDLLESNLEMKIAYEKYCLIDCVSLAQVDTKYIKNIHAALSQVKVDLGGCTRQLKPVEIEKCLGAPTAPGLMDKVCKIVNARHIKTTRNPHATGDYHTLSSNEFEFMKKCKIGGISHVGHPGFFGKLAIALIDVVSLYPTTFIFGQFPKGAPLETEVYMRGFLGCYRVINIQNPGLCISAVPNRKDDGRLDWSASFIAETHITSCDIETLERLGYKFEVKEGYYWKESWNPFKSFIEIFKGIKQKMDLAKGTPEYNQALRSVAKLLQNSFFGKLLQTCKTFEYKILKGDEIAGIDWDPKLGESLVYQQGRWVLKRASESKACPIHFGVFVLAQSRQLMQRYFDLIGRNNIIATETDSIYCLTKHLKPLIESSDPELAIGKEYGQMEVEYDDLTDCFFLEKKCYIVGLSDGNYKMAFKGVPAGYLSREKYLELYKNGEVTFENMEKFERHLFNGNNRLGITVGKTVKTVRQGKRKYRDYSWEHFVAMDVAVQQASEPKLSFIPRNTMSPLVEF